MDKANISSLIFFIQKEVISSHWIQQYVFANNQYQAMQCVTYEWKQNHGSVFTGVVNFTGIIFVVSCTRNFSSKFNHIQITISSMVYRSFADSLGEGDAYMRN